MKQIIIVVILSFVPTISFGAGWVNAKIWCEELNEKPEFDFTCKSVNKRTKFGFIFAHKNRPMSKLSWRELNKFSFAVIGVVDRGMSPAIKIKFYNGQINMCAAHWTERGEPLMDCRIIQKGEGELK